MGAVRYQQLMSDFPLWALALTIVGLGTGVFILKKYDFIRSNDSKLCVRCGYNNIKFDNYVTKPNKIMLFDKIMTINQENITKYNISFLKSIIQ